MGFILFSISFCIGKVLDELTLVYVAFRVGKDSFLIGIILEKYWFNIVLYFFLHWKSIGFICVLIVFCIGILEKVLV